MPSTCAVLTSARPARSLRTRAAFRCSAASASVGLSAAMDAWATPITRSVSPAIRRHIMCRLPRLLRNDVPLNRDRLEEIFDPTAAVSELVQPDPDPIEQREMEVGQRCAGLVPDMAAALHPARSPARDENGQVVMIVDAGVTQSASIQVNGVVEERPVALARGL